jgi:hypothetical protein
MQTDAAKKFEQKKEKTYNFNPQKTKGKSQKNVSTRKIYILWKRNQQKTTKMIKENYFLSQRLF